MILYDECIIGIATSISGKAKTLNWNSVNLDQKVIKKKKGNNTAGKWTIRMYAIPSWFPWMLSGSIKWIHLVNKGL